MEKAQTVKLSQLKNQPGSGEDAFVRVVSSTQEIATLRRLLREIIGGPAFKGSQRSGQFLEFVIEQSIAGNFNQLKERLIGVELFKRKPSYDTGDDAIVRVTASDVRKRLLQHYGWFGSDCEFRIELPLGSYVPRVTRKNAADIVEPNLPEPLQPPKASAIAEAGPQQAATPDAREHLGKTSSAAQFSSKWLQVRSVATLLLAVAFGWWLRSTGQSASSHPAYAILPWSAIFAAQGVPHLITSDANIDTIQGTTKTNLSLSDYANHSYVPKPEALTPEQLNFVKVLLSADSSAATPDLPITAKIAGIAQTFSKQLSVQASRSFQLSFLSSSDNFVFLGSPRSDPWFSVFASALSFQFVYDPVRGSEYIRDLHPQPKEQANYIPSANGGGTGYSFAVVAFVQNPDQVGEVLLLAGADGEATGAAGDFVTDLPRLSRALEACGIEPAGPARHFEMLLQTNTMAGVWRKTEVVTCHLLNNTPLLARPPH